MIESENLTPDQYLVHLEVGQIKEPIRLDLFLKRKYRFRSREKIKTAIRSGNIFLTRPIERGATPGALKPSTMIYPGDEIRLLSQKRGEPEVDFSYRKVFESPYLVVIDKPGNLPVHPAGKFFFHTLLIHLKTHGFKDELHLQREYFLVHRIDRETSGLLLLSKTREICAPLIEQFSTRRTKKRYLAIVHGKVQDSDFQIDQALGRREGSLVRVKMYPVAESEGGQSAVTLVRPLIRGEKFSLVECFPRTGRQHQIRAHLDLAGHPIVGDKLYGLKIQDALQFYDSRLQVEDTRRIIPPELEARLILPRHALHAANLSFQDPITGEMHSFESPLPEDMVQFVKTALPGSNYGAGFKF